MYEEIRVFVTNNFINKYKTRIVCKAQIPQIVSANETERFSLCYSNVSFPVFGSINEKTPHAKNQLRYINLWQLRL